MKKCQTCGFVNSDDMRFCLECGTLLANSPMVVNISESDAQSQSGPSTNPYGQSMETQFGGKYGPNQFSMVPPKRKRSNTKIFLAVGGVLALILMLFVGVGAIVAYKLFVNPNPEPFKPTPTPVIPTPSPVTPTPRKPSPSPTSTATPPKSNTAARATYDRMWVDYNVTEKGRLGMRIHVSFRIYNMKGVDSYLAVYFQKKDGTILKTSDRQFSSTSGQVAVFYSLRPGYDDAVYEDAVLFMPYDELNLPKGKYDLQMDVDVVYKNGDRLEHLTFYDFEYEKL